ncbi:TolC family protein [Sulfurovum sp.]|uniref:TolC family protein n=1 Tax=Sulfurovum sp. TaxID=1969726 RepID=UPI003562F500
MIRSFYIILFTTSLFSSTLDGLIQYAVKHSTVIKQSQTQVELAQLKREESRIQQYGSLDLIGDYTHYNTPRTLMPLTPALISSGGDVSTTQDLFSTGITYNVPLFTGFAQTRQIEIDDIAKQMSTAKASLTKEQLIYNIRSLYLSILAQEEIAIAQRSYTQALKKLTTQIAYEVKIGKKAKIDLFKVQSDFRASQTQQEILVSNIKITKATLSSLVGKNIGEMTPLSIKVKKTYYSVNKLYEQASGLAKVEMEDMVLSKADKMIAKSKSAKLPQVNLSSYVGKNYGEDLASKDWDNETLWQVGVNVKWNLVDFGKRDLSVQQAKIAKMEATFNKEQTLLDLRKLLTQGVEKIKQSYAEYLGSSAQLRLSKKSESIEKVRYENDVATLNDLLLAKGKRQLADAKLIESKYNYKKSIYYLDYLLERGMNQ